MLLSSVGVLDGSSGALFCEAVVAVGVCGADSDMTEISSLISKGVIEVSIVCTAHFFGFLGGILI
jgi:hypothetical protein